jgi:hypothetical protein
VSAREGGRDGQSFFDRRNLSPGLPWVRGLEKALNAAKAAIILIGPQGLGNTQQYEREFAIIRQTREPRVKNGTPRSRVTNCAHYGGCSATAHPLRSSSSASADRHSPQRALPG